jgi:ferredoxin-type protein NapF
LCPLGGTLDLLASIKSWLRIFPKTLSPQPPRSMADSMPDPQGRRCFVFAGAGVIIGLLARRLSAARREDAPLRPPGAVAESKFSGLCLRCGSCVRSCPARIIRADVGQAGMAGMLAPILCYEKEYCRENCAACTRVCPSGALRPLDLSEKTRYVIGEALMDGSLCVLALGQRDCDACARACPFGAVQIHWDEEAYLAYPIVDPEKCNGCGACEVACPTHGDKAIRVWKRAY